MIHESIEATGGSHRRKRKATAIIATMAIAGSVSGLAVGIASSALAVPSDDGAAAVTVERDGVTFYTQHGVEVSWAGWVDEFPIPLPPGVALPGAPTAFFEMSADEGPTLFEDGLPQAILSRFARCAWLDVVVSAGRSWPGLEARAHGELARYEEYPGVSAGLDVAAFEREVRAAADAEGIHPNDLEYQIECGHYSDALAVAEGADS